MATIDISILNSVSTVIVFMLVFVGGWGMLSLVDPFKDKGKSFYGIMAFLMAVMVVLSKKTVNIILIATPWMMLLGLIMFFFIFVAKMFGGNDIKIPIGEPRVYGWVIFFVAIILLFAIGGSFGQDLLSAQPPGSAPTETVVVTDGEIQGGSYTTVETQDFGRNLTLTLFHPKILGILFLFLLGTMSILLLQG